MVLKNTISKTKKGLLNHMQAVLKEKNFDGFIIACRDILKIAKEKGFYTRSLYAKYYYKENKEKFKEKTRKYYKKHKKELREYHAEYYKNNPDKMKAYRVKRKKAISEYNHLYYLTKRKKNKGD